jgi:hypothetical protein
LNKEKSMELIAQEVDTWWNLVQDMSATNLKEIFSKH